MLHFRVKALLISIDFSFFLVVSIALLMSDELIVYSGFLACAAHEIGHLFAMLMCRIYPERIKLYGGGICIFANKVSLLNIPRRIFILLSGALINLFFFVVLRNKMPVFAAINLIIGIFNLLPFSCFDGGAVISVVAEKVLPNCKYLKYERLTRIGDCVITALLIFVNIIYGAGGIFMTAALVYTIILQLYQEESDF